MKRFYYTLAAALAMVTLCLLTSTTTNTAKAGIVGSKHDFGITTWSQGQICLPCHAPHNTTPVATDGGEVTGPLWNRAVDTSKTYKMYVNGTKVDGKVDTNSILCLSCHDGVAALDSFGGGAGTTKLNFVADVAKSPNLGTDLSNDHPIGEGAIWPTPTPSFMVDPAKRAAATGGAIMPLRKMTDGRLAVGCTSCHEPHNRKNTNYMLWVANDKAGTTVDGRAVSGSVLCLNCHIK